MSDASENATPRLLVLGGGGMLGHKLTQRASGCMEVVTTVRRPLPDADGLFQNVTVREGFDATKADRIQQLLADVRPDVVVNCIGVVKQRVDAPPRAQIAVNALFPHVAAEACTAQEVRFIHLSTDCVFSGAHSLRRESDRPDAHETYGLTKRLGEVCSPGCLTLRTSMIGRELSGRRGLLEWFLSQEGGRVKGYRRSVFSGFTTLALVDTLLDVIRRFPELDGLYHLAADPISKHDLLCLIRDVYGLDVIIEADDDIVCDRSLDGSRFREATGWAPPNWEEMVEEMHADSTPYETIRGDGTRPVATASGG